ncbi:hypothetical protein ASD02_36140 [Ensifer sp. Root1252]|nr:hypothetical protein ASD02_36140 [Ensifer sp. Root1252]KRC62245.1 hypothetical protein ASE32_36230 [Ensifer sp. Root231]KRC91144.1 hypothetical protein ASE47_36200 [Ensifer sp. Root258]
MAAKSPLLISLATTGFCAWQTSHHGAVTWTRTGTPAAAASLKPGTRSLAFLKQKLTRLEGVASIEASFALSQIKHSQALPF